MKSKIERINWQKRVKEDHKDRIISLLKERKVMRFKDFEIENEKTGIKSPKGLGDVLQRLVKEGFIEKSHMEIEIEKGKPKTGLHGEILERDIVKKKVEAYALTSEGQKYQSWWLIHELFDLRAKNAGYFHSISTQYALFGLSEDIVMGRATENKISNFDIPPLQDIENFIMLEIFRKIKEDNIKPDINDSKLLVSFEFDFAQLAKQIIQMQMFIEDINSGRDIFADKRLILWEQVDKLWIFDFFINYSVLLGDEKYLENLKSYLKNFSKEQKFYELTQVDSKLFKRFLDYIAKDKDPIKDSVLFKTLIVPVEKGIGYYNYFSRYIKGAKMINYRNAEFYKKLDEFEKRLSEKTRKMAMEWAFKEQKKIEAKQKGEPK